MKRTVIKKLTAFAAITTMVIGSTAMSFASTDNPQTVPAHINVPATVIDFTVTEKINMTGSANSNELIVDSLSVTNNNAIGVLNINSIQANGVNGWTLVDDSMDFKTIAKDAKKLSLVAADGHDMTAEYTAAGTVDPGQTDTTTFTGKTGIVTTAVDDEQAADIVVTVSII
ncbi:MAG: hypothetical protein KH297_04625 [Firmicutes bacterium]|nr:hypothetical protein [Bacillota bacterium]